MHVNLADQAEAHNLFGKEVFALKGSCSELDESLEKDCDECSAHRPKAKGRIPAKDEVLENKLNEVR